MLHSHLSLLLNSLQKYTAMAPFSYGSRLTLGSMFLACSCYWLLNQHFLLPFYQGTLGTTWSSCISSICASSREPSMTALIQDALSLKPCHQHPAASGPIKSSLLGHSQIFFIHFIHGCFWGTVAELWQKSHDPKADIIYFLFLSQRKFVNTHLELRGPHCPPFSMACDKCFSFCSLWKLF